MDDPLATIRSLAAANNAHADQLRKSLHELESRVSTCLAGVDIYVSSKNTVFEEGVDGDAVYGFLSFSDGKLSVAYRSREDDWNDALDRGDPTDPSYSEKQIDECPFKWLVAICDDKVVSSFFENMVSQLNAQKEEVERGLTVLSRALSAPIRNAESALVTAARQLGYESIVVEWTAAQASLAVDPREAVTKASSLVESVCKHILETLKTPLRSDLSIQPLVRATTRALTLSPEVQATSDLRQMAMGVVSVAIGLGALRTHVGTAHGRGANVSEPSQAETRLAVNMAGALSTFLMESLRSMLTKEGAPT